MEKTKPQSELIAIKPIVVQRARRYWAVDVEDAVSANRRRNWNRMASLMNVALIQYAAFVT